MKKYKKKCFYMLILAMLFSFSACDSKDANKVMEIDEAKNKEVNITEHSWKKYEEEIQHKLYVEEDVNKNVYPETEIILHYNQKLFKNADENTAINVYIDGFQIDSMNLGDTCAYEMYIPVGKHELKVEGDKLKAQTMEFEISPVVDGISHSECFKFMYTYKEKIEETTNDYGMLESDYKEIYAGLLREEYKKDYVDISNIVNQSKSSLEIVCKLMEKENIPFIYYDDTSGFSNERFDFAIIDNAGYISVAFEDNESEQYEYEGIHCGISEEEAFAIMKNNGYEIVENNGYKGNDSVEIYLYGGYVKGVCVNKCADIDVNTFLGDDNSTIKTQLEDIGIIWIAENENYIDKYGTFEIIESKGICFSGGLYTYRGIYAGMSLEDARKILETYGKEITSADNERLLLRLKDVYSGDSSEEYNLGVQYFDIAGDLVCINYIHEVLYDTVCNVAIFQDTAGILKNIVEEETRQEIEQQIYDENHYTEDEIMELIDEHNLMIEQGQLYSITEAFETDASMIEIMETEGFVWDDGLTDGSSYISVDNNEFDFSIEETYDGTRRNCKFGSYLSIYDIYVGQMYKDAAAVLEYKGFKQSGYDECTYVKDDITIKMTLFNGEQITYLEITKQDMSFLQDAYYENGAYEDEPYGDEMYEYYEGQY